jgi:hypothetical protein
VGQKPECGTEYSDGKLKDYGKLPAKSGACYLDCVYGWLVVNNADERPEVVVQMRVSPFAK